MTSFRFFGVLTTVKSPPYPRSVIPFAQELNAAMSAAGLTAAELADRSGLTEAAISYLRSGQRGRLTGRCSG
jgi:hypothetical protein